MRPEEMCSWLNDWPATNRLLKWYRNEPSVFILGYLCVQLEVRCVLQQSEVVSVHRLLLLLMASSERGVAAQVEQPVAKVGLLRPPQG